MIIHTLIIEDEPPAAQRLSKLVRELRPDWTILQTLDSVEDAVDFFENNPSPQLVFMDIQLADGLSFEIFKKTKVNCPIIFTTAYNNHTLDAFKVNSVDYLLKPIDKNELASALDKFEATRLPAVNTELITELVKQIAPKSEKERKRFLVKTAGRLSFVPVEEIAYFFSDDGHAFIHTKNGDRFLVDHTIEEIEHDISPDHFFRINRKMIVHIDSIVRIEHHFNNRFLIETQPKFEEEIIVSRLRVQEFKDWLDQ
jgi:DNA-binding LytR/AlgR family response regulator